MSYFAPSTDGRNYGKSVTQTRRRILLAGVREDEVVRLESALEGRGYEIESASAPEGALRRLQGESFDLLIVDLNLPGLDASKILSAVEASSPTKRRVPGVCGASRRAAVGVTNCATGHPTNRGGNEDLDDAFASIVGRSKPMKELLRTAKLIAESPTTVLIQGESGTGKEMLARAIHHHSLRRDRPFAAIDCGALPEPLFESELFGYKRGAFTGAIAHRDGLFQYVHGGTLLLDEVANTTPALQAKLLRVLQEHEVRPLGSNTSVKTDVRVIAATNQNLKTLVDQKSFREDLYYRLAVLPIVIPPLRERRDDIPLLVDHFIGKYCGQNRRAPKPISSAALELLERCSWPGNVRELENVIARAVLLSTGPEIGAADIFLEGAERERSISLNGRSTGALEIMEREKISTAIQQAGANRSRAAKRLGISRTTLYKKLNRYRIA